jgi:hypothetical protein
VRGQGAAAVYAVTLRPHSHSGPCDKQHDAG